MYSSAAEDLARSVNYLRLFSHTIPLLLTPSATRSPQYHEQERGGEASDITKVPRAATGVTSETSTRIVATPQTGNSNPTQYKVLAQVVS